MANPEKANPEKKVRTLIPGLDKVLDGGLVAPPRVEAAKAPKPEGRDGLVVLVKGKSGCGKSTLALQMAAGLARSLHGRAHYYTLEQDPRNETAHFQAKLDAMCQGHDELRANLVSFNPNSTGHSPSELPYSGDSTPLARALDVVSTEDLAGARDLGVPPVIVVDGLNAIPGDERRWYVDFSQMVRRLRFHSRFSIIVYEPSESPDDDWIDYLVDMIIAMEADQHTGAIEYLLHRLTIPKSRYQRAALGWQQYKLGKEGIQIYPSIHFIVHRPKSMQDSFDGSLTALRPAARPAKVRRVRGAPGSPSVVEHVLGVPSVERGSCTVLLGARGTFKSILSLDFLFRGANRNDAGLLVSLIDNQPTVIAQATCPLRKLGRSCVQSGLRRCAQQKAKSCHDKVFVFHQRPGCIAPPEFFHYLSERLNRPKAGPAIKRVAFWDLTQLEYRFPLFSDEKMFLPALVDLCKARDVALLIMGAGNAALTRAASAMADNVVFCWRDTVANTEGPPEECLALYVDRTQGKLGSEGKALYSLPVKRDGGTLLGFDPALRESESEITAAPEKIRRIVEFQDIQAPATR
ncbi:MAG: hypothetical protein JW940_09310 [Polyangiaceae bacterium]|nr:hypothetical protein [Polyangiaceae bacterium]